MIEAILENNTKVAPSRDTHSSPEGTLQIVW